MNETHAECIERIGKEVADARYNADIADDRADRILAACFLESSGNVEERKSKAKGMAQYQTARDDALKSKHNLNTCQAKFKGAEAAFDEWRTQSANTRKAERAI